MATKLTIVPIGTINKRDLWNKEKYMKIGVFFQKLSWNERIACTKMRGKKIKLLKVKKK